MEHYLKNQIIGNGEFKKTIYKNQNTYILFSHIFYMEKQYKQVRFRLSSWNKLRRAFYGRRNETFSDYIERISKEIKK